MDLQRRVFAAAALALLVLGGKAGAADGPSGMTASTAASTVYYVRYAVSDEAGDDERVHYSYQRAALQPAPRAARQLLLTPLWAQQTDAAGKASYLLDLDPGNPEDAQQIQVLAAGFSSVLPAAGEPEPLQAVDPAAWSALSRRSAPAAQDLLAAQQAPGLRPVTLPAAVAVGDRLQGWQRIAPYRSAKVTLQVIQVTPDAVLMGMHIDDAGAQGEGRVVVRRADGMPIELRMELRFAAIGKRPASTHRVHLADVRHDLMLHMADDLQGYLGYVEQTEQTLRQPPFSRPSSDAAVYARPAVPRGALQPYMVGADELPALQPFMGALWVPSETGNGQWLAIGARADVGARRPPGQARNEQFLISRLHAVDLLDGNGAPIAALAPQRVARTLFFPEKYSAAQNEMVFPFHLPLKAPRQVLQQIAAVRMRVDAEVYQAHATENLKADGRSTINAAATVQHPSPYRATLLQGRQGWKEKTGIYSVAVALDEDGNELPSQQLSIAPYQRVAATRLAEVPLAWENSTLPMRTEIATQRPIASVELRHYRWTSVPQTWVFPMYP